MTLPGQGVGGPKLTKPQRQIVDGFIGSIARLDQSLQGVRSSNDALGQALKTGDTTKIAMATQALRSRLSAIQADRY